MAKLNDKLAALATMSLAQLRDEWSQAYDAASPMVPAGLLRLAIRRPAAQAPSPGTRLVRTWQGRTISVLVTDDGFQFDDRSYSSLTSIACEVTNSKRSGPRFFGLIDHA
ncbi:MAG: DUF2924 domain-containing protein [Sphingomonas sp.]|nr:DUF2924 domain-containing protein [Sphingomonas sp.]